MTILGEIVSELTSGDAWSLATAGRVLLRVRQETTPPVDAWYVVVPEVPNVVPCGSQNATVTMSITVAAGAEVGAAVTFAAPGLTGYSLSLYVNLTTNAATPSFAYVEVPASATGLPSSIKVTLATRVTSLPSLNELDISVSTTGDVAGIAVIGGIVDGTATVGPAKIVATASQLLQAIADLVGLGLLNDLATLTGKLSLNVPIPQQDADQAALTDPNVRSCAGAAILLTLPTPAPFNLPASDPLKATLKLNQTDTQVTWHTHVALMTTVVLVLKDEVVSNGTTDHATTINMQGVLPTQASLDITDAPETFAYSASATIPSLDVMVRSSAKDTTTLAIEQRATRAHVDDLPVKAVVSLGRYDPTLSTNIATSVTFTDAGGQAAAATRVALSTTAGLVPIALPAATPHGLAVTYNDGPLTAQAYGLESANVLFTIANPSATEQKVAAAVGLTLDAVLPADIEVTIGTNQVSATTAAFPTTFKASGSGDFLSTTPPTDNATLGWSNSTAMDLAITYTNDTIGNADYRKLQTSLTAIPATFTAGLQIANQIARSQTTASTDFGAVAATYWFGADPAELTVNLSSVPQKLDGFVDYKLTDVWFFEYGANSAIARSDVTFTSPDLRAPDPTAIMGVPALDHLAAFVLDLPKTSGATNDPAASHILGIVISSTTSPGIAAEVAVPASVDPFGFVTFELTDQQTTTAPTVASEITFEQCTRRQAGWFGDQLASLSAPTGRRTYVAVPKLRLVKFDSLLNEPNHFAQTSTKPLSVLARIDKPAAVTMDIAQDSYTSGDPAVSSQWLHGQTKDITEVVIDGSLEDSLTSLAVELLPQAVTVAAVIQSYDGSAKPADSSPDPDVVALAHNQRIDLQAVLPDRLVLQLGQVEDSTTINTTLTRPPVTGFPAWDGQRFESAANVLLPAQPTPIVDTDVWVRVAQNHDADPTGWSSWLAFDDTRAHIRMIDTVTVQVPVPPNSGDDRKHVKTGNPHGFVEVHVASMEVFAHVAALSIAERSTGTGVAANLLPIGTDYPTFVGLAAGDLRRVTVVIDDLAAHQGTSPNQLVATGFLVPETLRAVITPASLFRVNGTQLQELWLDYSRDARPLVEVEGSWVYGYPLLTPAAGAVVDNNGDPRPAGLTGIKALATPHPLQASYRQHWAGGQSPPPLSEIYTSTINIGSHSPMPMRIEGWTTFDRPSPALEPTMQSEFTAIDGNTVSQGVVLVQSTVQTPSYGSGTNLPPPGPPGTTADTVGAAFFLNVEQICLSRNGALDADENPLPVFLADDTNTCQPGIEGQVFALRAPTTTLPISVKTISVELEDWPDAPQQTTPTTLTTLNVAQPPQNISFSQELNVFAAQGGGRPSKFASTTVSSAFVDSSGFSGVNDTTGPPIGEVQLDISSLDTSACRWAPTISTLSGQLTQVPGWLRIIGTAPVDPTHFPQSTDPTNLSMGSWNAPIDYDAGALHPHDRPWITSLTTLACSGSLAGSLDIEAASQQWNNGGPTPPSSAPDQISWNRMLIDNLLLDVTPGGDPSQGVPNLTIISGIAGPPNKDDEQKGLAFRVAQGSLLTAVIKSSTGYSHFYDDVPRRGSDITNIGDNLSTITFDAYVGELAVQPPADIDLDWLIAAIIAGIAAEAIGTIFSFFGEIIGAVIGAGLITTGIYVTLDVNDPVVLDTAQARWRIDPDPSKLPPGVKQVFDYFGPNGNPGTWHMWPAWPVVSEGLIALALLGGSELIQFVAPLIADAVMYCIECGGACLGFVAIP
ncbi:MAG TPA: hypothetical protein VG650_03925 [Mycobacteriales bacterium]|nr:hypothetical protein [Mycobacteriales bacterium]